MNRVRVYIDGCNLYNGLRDKHGSRYQWLDLERLSTSLLRQGQHLDLVRYFTAHLRGDGSGRQNQTLYHSALLAHCPKVEIVEGHFQQKTGTCPRCLARWRTYEEKETDVNIAVSMIEDGVLGLFDVVVLVSADRDLAPAIRSLRRLRPDSKVVVAFPPRRQSEWLGREADAVFRIGDTKIRRALLPETVITSDGIKLRRPATWL